MHSYDYAEFQRNKRKEARKYEPNDAQVETAMSRIVGVFRKHNGWIDALGEKELVCFMARKVFNRGRELGDYKRGEFKATLSFAVRQLVRKGTIATDGGAYGLTDRIPDVRRHRQKYPNRGQRRAA